MMTEPKPTTGARALLFERLTDSEPASQSERRPFRIHDLDALSESVRRELARLLNTRCPCPERLRENAERTVLEYGIPDFSSLSAASEADRSRLAGMIEQALSAYEPRLRQIHAAFQPGLLNPAVLHGRIEAVLVAGMVNAPISFPILVQARNGVMEVIGLGE
ncbi:MAG: type VI secretion system baseplate subunit TssE [Terriglobia bacterium]